MPDSRGWHRNDRPELAPVPNLGMTLLSMAAGRYHSRAAGWRIEDFFVGRVLAFSCAREPRDHLEGWSSWGANACHTLIAGSLLEFRIDSFPKTEFSNRPWAPPRTPWVLRQRWLDLLFAHWPVPATALRSLVPPALTIQEFEGTSWVGIVPFEIQGLSWRPLPDLPYFSAFPELNLRLYVEVDDRPGVWFISLDADNAAAVFGARTAFALPYWRAQISMRREGGAVSFRSVRRRQPEVAFDITYRPVGEPATSAPGTLDYFLTERYCLYTVVRGRLRRLEIDHPPWQLRRAVAEIRTNTLASAQGVPLDTTRAPLLHFSRSQDVIAWWPDVVSEKASTT
jgi:hypothetical protein